MLTVLFLTIPIAQSSFAWCMLLDQIGSEEATETDKRTRRPNGMMLTQCSLSIHKLGKDDGLFLTFDAIVLLPSLGNAAGHKSPNGAYIELT